MRRMMVLPLLLGMALAASDVATPLKVALMRPPAAKMKCQHIQDHYRCEGAVKGLPGVWAVAELYTPSQKRLTITRGKIDITQLAAQRKTYRDGTLSAVKLLSGPLKGVYVFTDARTRATVLETEALHARR